MNEHLWERLLLIHASGWSVSRATRKNGCKSTEYLPAHIRVAASTGFTVLNTNPADFKTTCRSERSSGINPTERTRLRCSSASAMAHPAKGDRSGSAIILQTGAIRYGKTSKRLRVSCCQSATQPTIEPGDGAPPSIFSAPVPVLVNYNERFKISKCRGVQEMMTVIES
jgi:hypothetical protein